MIEVRNETKKKLYVALCKTSVGSLYLHISDKKTKHVPILVKPSDYEQIEPKKVLA